MRVLLALLLLGSTAFAQAFWPPAEYPYPVTVLPPLERSLADSFRTISATTIDSTRFLIVESDTLNWDYCTLPLNFVDEDGTVELRLAFDGKVYSGNDSTKVATDKEIGAIVRQWCKKMADNPACKEIKP